MASESFPQPVAAAKGRRITAIWILPLLAALLAGFLGIDYLMRAGPRITIVFEDGAGLRADQTVINYRGVQVGLVETVQLKKDLERVEVIALLDASAAALAREGSTFWIVRPRLGPRGLQGMDALTSGAYIQVQPGKGKKEQRRFVGRQRMSLTPVEPGGLSLKLTTGRADGLSLGAPLHFRGLEVGFISGTRLADDARAVHVEVYVHQAYVPLVRSSSRFWRVGGLDMDFSLFGGADIRLRSLRALLNGGLVFATPSAEDEPASPDTIFTLHDEPKKEWLRWDPAIEIIQPK